jgi:hypothetical protein
MAQRAPIAPIPQPEDSPLVCQHHWVIQPADGPSSNGSCQVCGETREFKNYVESATWGDSRLTAKSSAKSSDSDSESSSDDEPDPTPGSKEEEDED